MFRYLGVMPELATLLDQLIETTPPADDPTGRSTFDALETLRLIRNTVDHQIVAHAAQLDDLGVAQKAGSTTKKLLIESGHAPAAALRTMRSVDALPALPALTRHAADGRLTGEVVDYATRRASETAVGHYLDELAQLHLVVVLELAGVEVGGHGLDELRGVDGADRESDGRGALSFVDSPTLQFGRGESVELPYRYLVADPTTSEPLMAPGMRDIIYRDFDRTFDI